MHYPGPIRGAFFRLVQDTNSTRSFGTVGRVAARAKSDGGGT